MISFCVHFQITHTLTRSRAHTLTPSVYLTPISCVCVSFSYFSANTSFAVPICIVSKVRARSEIAVCLQLLLSFLLVFLSVLYQYFVLYSDYETSFCHKMHNQETALRILKQNLFSIVCIILRLYINFCSRVLSLLLLFLLTTV